MPQMNLPRHGASDHTQPTAVRSSSTMNALRTSFFAAAGASAARYGLSFDDVVTHLWHARRLTGPIHLRLVHHLDDLTHASACAMNHDRAWCDLTDTYERWLVRRIRPNAGQIDALLEVRRFFNLLRDDENGVEVGVTMSLSAYRGYVPLKVWLANALIESRQCGGQLPRALEITERLSRTGTSFPGS